MIYIYPEKNLRANPGVLRGTEEWANTYRIRTTVERDINHMKENLCLAADTINLRFGSRTIHYADSCGTDHVKTKIPFGSTRYLDHSIT